jgi:5-formyltetrahydrofolate cyclo-ligase
MTDNVSTSGPGGSVNAAKAATRSRIWSLLESQGAVGGPAHGRIPDFSGAAAAARRLGSLDAWASALVVVAVPDKPQGPVRVLALAEGKLLYMAVPKLAGVEPFYFMEPGRAARAPDRAGHTDNQRTQTVRLDEIRPVDLVVTGCVAVNLDGARLGKGAGYFDIEIALLAQAGLVGKNTTIVTTVHDLQVIDQQIPEARHDARVDVIVTPTRTLRCPRAARPAGLVWDVLTPEKIAAIPVLAALVVEPQTDRPGSPKSGGEG